MQIRIQLFAVVTLTAMIAVGFTVARSASPSPLVAVASTMPVIQAPSIQEAPTTPPEEPAPTYAKKEALTAWVLEMMTRLAPEKHDAAFWHDIAADIAQVSLAESPDNPAKSASVLTSLAFHEGRFRAYVDSGQCNDRAWRKSKEGQKTMANGGDCDGGYAYSLWQIHPWEATITGPDLIRERRTAARVAWLYIKRNGFCGYSGEGNDCPKARIRQEVAQRYLAKHPFTG